MPRTYRYRLRLGPIRRRERQARLADLTLSKTSLTFTAADWAEAQTVTVSAGQDDDAVDDTVVLRHGATGGDYAGVQGPAVTVTVQDDDTAGVSVSRTGLTIPEGESGHYTVVLTSKPTAAVAVTVGGHAGSDLTLSKTSLTFTAADWAEAQTVTVSAGQDDDAGDDTAVLRHGATGGDYAGVQGPAVTVTVQDDDTAGVSVSRTGLTIPEGESGRYTVVLTSKPTAAVAVTVGGHAGSDLTLSKTSLTFTAADWDEAQTVTVSAGQDDDAGDDTAVLRHGATGGDYAGVQGPAVTVTVDDDDTAGVSVSRTGLTIPEGESGRYTVMLTSKPTAAVTVTVTRVGGAGSGVTVDDASLTFTRTNWAVAQTVTVSAGQDDDAEDETATLRHGAAGGDYAGVQGAAVTVTVQDDDTAGVSVSRTGLTIPEGESGRYTVVLTSEPTAAVTVTVVIPPGADISVGDRSLEFTRDNWDEAQTVTVSAGQDADAVNDTVVLRHGAQGGDYAGVQGPAVTVTVQDGDTAAVSVSRTALEIGEGDSDTYTVMLTSEPTAAVTVTVGITTGTDISVTNASLTFTRGNWDEAQTVTVSAGQDDDAVDDTAVLRHGAQGGDYTGVQGPAVTVTVRDDDRARVWVSPTELELTEGDSDTYTVVLTSEPTARVTVTVRRVSGMSLAVMPLSLTFTALDWSEAQTVTVSAVQDDNALHESWLLQHGAQGGDYSGVQGSAVTVTVTDDDRAGVRVSRTALEIDEGESGSYTVVLTSQPAAAVTVAVGIPPGTDISVTNASLTFTRGSWDVAQTVTVSAGEDDDALDDTVVLRHGAQGGDYSGVQGPAVTVTVDDNDTAAVSVSPTSLGIAEGRSGIYTVVLTSEPTAVVTVSVGIPPGTDISVNNASLTFTASDWDEAQTVTVSAGQDDDAVDDTVVLRHGAQGGDYSGLQGPAVTVTVRDDDTVAVTVSRTALGINEGGSDIYTVVLTSEPTNAVTVTVVIPPGTDVSVNDRSLEFTRDNWDVAQTVTVSAGQDDDAVDDTAVLRHDAQGGDYTGVQGPAVTVTVDDNDTAGVSVSPTALTIPEGESRRYTVVLTSEPTNAVTVTVVIPPGTDVSVNDRSLEFTRDNWDEAQTVTVSAGQDADAVDDTAVLRHGAQGGDYSGVQGLAVTVTVQDDDTAEVSVSRTALTIPEGESRRYTVVLTSKPTAAVTVTVTRVGGAGSEVTVDDASLTFTAADWAEAQTVTVSAGQDDDAEDEAATLRHGAAGGDYAGVQGAAVTVTVQDDDTAGVSVSRTGLTIPEGESGRYTVVLTSKPTAAVTVTVTRVGGAGSGVTVDDASLTFTRTNWAVVQTVTVSAGQDDDAEDEAATLRHGAAGGDYAGVQGAAVTVTVQDDDTAGVSVSRTGLTIPEGESGRYTVVLTSKPTAAVTVTVTRVGGAGSGVTVDDASLTFTRTNWAVVQTVTVNAGQDDDAEDETATLRHGAAGGDYAGVQGPAVTVTVQDDDTAGVSVSRTALTIPEGESGRYTVVLTSEPAAAVTVTVGGHAGSDLTLSKTSLTFTAADWAEAQTVTVSAGQDDDAVDDTVVLRHGATGGDYAGVQGAAVTVTVQDDDTAGVSVSRTGLTIPEGESGRYTVVLTSKPTAAVAVTVGGHAGSDLTLSKTSLTFTAADWDEAQTVTVSAGQQHDRVVHRVVVLTRTYRYRLRLGPMRRRERQARLAQRQIRSRMAAHRHRHRRRRLARQHHRVAPALPFRNGQPRSRYRYPRRVVVLHRHRHGRPLHPRIVPARGSVPQHHRVG